jgi:uncharacterized protein
MSLRSLSKMVEIKNLATLKQIMNSFEQAFLYFSTNKFDYSIKKQILNPKKTYCIDNGFATTMGFRFSKDKGNFLENLAAIELKRRNKEIYYFREKNECDFVIKEKLKIKGAIQVCYDLNDNNKKREIKGLLNALNKFKLKKGLILTYDQEDIINKDNKTIIVEPVWKWLLK